jgi:TonB family protein
MSLIRRTFILAIVLAQTSPATAASKPPTGLWHVQFDGAQCVGLREYGSQSKPLTLVLKPSPSGAMMRVIVIRPGFTEIKQFGETIRFDHDTINTNALYFEDDANKLRMVASNVPMERFNANVQSQSIGIGGAAFTGSFAVPDLPSVVGGLDQCLGKLRDQWNIADTSRIAAQPSGSLNGVLTNSDYPLTTMYKGQQGTVALTLLVDVDGRIRDCGVDETSGVAFLDAASCYHIIHRARLTPALGRDGKPVRSAYTARITWKIVP